MGETADKCCITIAILISLLALAGMSHVDDRVDLVNERVNQVIRYTETVVRRVERIESAHGLPSRVLDDPVHYSKEALVQALVPCWNVPQLQRFMDCLNHAVDEMTKETPVPGK